MDADFTKVMTAIAKAGITPAQLAGIIMPQMYNIMTNLDRVDMTMDHFMAYVYISHDIESLEEMIDGVTTSLDT